MDVKKRILILGAGFGGLRAAMRVSKKLRSLGLLPKYEIILIDRSAYHTYTPLLYELATTSAETAGLKELRSVVAHNIEDVIRGCPITFIRSEITAIDSAAGTITVKDAGALSFDYAIIALGSEPNYFSIKGLKEHSFTLKTFGDAVKIRDAVSDMAAEQHEVNIVIGGGGSTGVELAGELSMWCGELSEAYRGCEIKVTIVEAAPDILPGFRPNIVAKVKKRLGWLDVTIAGGSPIESVEKNKAVLKGGKEIPFDIFVWAGGVKAPSLLEQTDFKLMPGSHIEIDGSTVGIPKTPDLKFSSMVYAIGDSTCLHDPETGRPVPSVARAAIDQADVAAHNLIEEIKSEEFENLKLSARGGSAFGGKIKTYKPREYPFIIPVGGKFAVAKIGPFVISGFFGWVLKGLVELNYLVSIMPLWRAIRIWLKGLRIFIQNDRLG